jgi:DcmR-like sensory protein
VGIYSNQESELNHAVQFLKRGLDNNESAILITDYAPRERIKDIISSNWDTKNVDKLEQNGDLTIASSAEWYLTEENSSTTNINKIVNSWSRICHKAIIRGKTGIRAFGDTRTFFKRGLVDYLLEYEDKIGRKPNIPILAICAYLKSDVLGLTRRNYRKLQDAHAHIFLLH